jgi:hypothetical protein
MWQENMEVRKVVAEVNAYGPDFFKKLKGWGENVAIDLSDDVIEACVNIAAGVDLSLKENPAEGRQAAALGIAAGINLLFGLGEGRAPTQLRTEEKAVYIALMTTAHILAFAKFHDINSGEEFDGLVEYELNRGEGRDDATGTEPSSEAP